MKRLSTIILVAALVMLSVSATFGQIPVTVSGTAVTSPPLAGSYTSLANALAALNSVTSYTTPGTVIFTCAGGNSETAPPTGLTIGSATLNPLLSATNTITINTSGGVVTLNAGVGTATPSSAAPDGILKLTGADYVTIDGLTLTDGNLANPATMEFGIGLFKAGAGDGCNNNTIKNCTINMQRINNASGTLPMFDGSVGILVINSTATAATTALTPTNGGTLATNGTNSGNRFYSNTINGGNYGIALSGYGATSGVGPAPTPTTFLGDLGNDIGGGSTSTGNTILNYGGGGTTNPAAGIRANNQWSVNISYNTINNNNGLGVNHATTLRGIFAQAGTSANATINNNTLTVQSGATTSACSAIENGIGSTAAANTVSISNNTINVNYSTATTGVYNGILNSATAATVNIDGNSITMVSGGDLAGTGTHVMIETGSPTTVTTNSNSITNIRRSGASGSWRGIKTSSPTNWTCNGNTIDGLSWTAAASTGSIDAIYSLSFAVNVTVNNNIIRNLATPTTGTINGIREFGGSGTKTFQNNQVYNFSTTAGGAGGASFNGIFCSTGTIDISNNQIYSLNSTGTTGGTGGLIRGIQVSGGTASNIYKNKIYDLSTTSTTSTSGAVSGVLISGNTANTIYNNLIGDLRATASAATDAIRGISITSTTSSSTINVYYNTVYMNATSSGTNFGTSGIFHTTSATATTAALNLRNNIIVNTSTPNGTGLTVAYRRSSTTLTNYASTSNNNDFYAGTPDPSHLIFYDGTNSDQTIAAYKTRVSPIDAASFSENPTFVSTIGSDANFLHINTSTPTQIESGGQSISGITDDYDGDLRHGTTPDVGADEFAGVGLDLTPPTISYTPLSNSIVAASRSFTGVTITDASGVNGTASTRPRVYYKRSTDGNVWNDNTSGTDGWKYAEASGSTSPFDFTIDYSLLNGGTGVSIGTIVQYFVVAQDLAPTPNVGINSGTFASTPSSVALTSAAFPIGGTINSYTTLASLSGTYTVGSGGTYATLKAAFDDINGKVLTGNVTLQVLASGTTETATATLNQVVYDGGTWTITVKPDPAVHPLATPTITGSIASGPIIKLNGASNVIIDGSTSGGTDRSLTITNTATTAPTVISLASLGTGLGCSNVTVKNCNISTGVATSIGYGIAVGGSTPGTSGADNDNVTIENNAITNAPIGIYANGTASVSSGGNDNLAIIGNSIDYNSTLASIGIRVGNALNSSVSQNTVSQQTSASQAPTAISLELGFVSSTVTRNIITKSLTTHPDGYGGRGITVGTGTDSSNLTIANNVIYGVNGTNRSLFSRSSMGIAIGTIGSSSILSTIAGGINLYYNSVNMWGTYSSSTACLTTALYIGVLASALDIRNNIFVNSLINTGTGTSSKAYAIYSNVTSVAFTAIDYNDYFVSGTQGVLGFLTSDRTDLAAIQAGFGGNTNSMTSDPQFNSNTNLRPQLGSPVLAAGTPITGITTDILGTTRNPTTPSIGAYEEGVDVAGPAISYTPLTNTTSTSDRVLTAFATITDPSGVNTSSGTNPRIYYKKSTHANTFIDNTSATDGWKYVEASNAASPFNFTINYSLLFGGSGVVLNDVIQYFVVAQDLASPPNVGINSGTFAATPSSVALTSAAFPIGGTIRSYQIIDVPLSGDYLIIGSEAFGRAIGRNIVPEKRTRVVARPVQFQAVPSNTSSEDATDRKGEVPPSAGTTDAGSEITSRPGTETFEEEYVVLTENGQPYNGPLSAELPQNGPNGPHLVTYPTLTAAIADVNLRGVSGPTRFLITSTYPGSATETFPLVINAIAGASATNTLTIKPASGATPTISGSSTTGIFAIHSPYVTIDGDNEGGTVDRDLTISNTLDAANTYVVGLFNTGAPNIAQNVTIKNCNISGGAAWTAIAWGIILNAAGGDYDNTVIQNNLITKVRTGIQFAGVSGATTDNGQITNNIIGSTTDALSCYGQGILVSFTDNLLIQGNEIIGQVLGNTGLATDIATAAKTGISIINSSTNTKIRRNSIHDFFYNGTGGFGAFGIVYGPGSTTNTGTTEISNNMIYNIKGDGDDETTSPAFMGWLPQGICIYNNGTAAVQIYFNSIYLSGAVLGATWDGSSACIGIANTVGAGSLDIRNNILRNSMTPSGTPVTNETMGIWVAGSSSSNTIFGNINWNNYDGTGGHAPRVGYLNGFAANLAAWQTATAQDANSKSFTTDFFSTTDLHLNVSSVNHNYDGQPIGGITVDFDGDTRDPMAPYIGADEVPGFPLPITLGSFTARMNPNGPGVLLEWMTISEINNYGFYVQRRRENEQQWTELPGFVHGHGTTTEPQFYSYVDNTITQIGLYHYRLRQVDLDGTSHFSPSISVNVTSLTAVEEIAPRVFQLLPNYPNPFNPETIIKFSVESTAHTTLELYNVVGQKVATLFNDVAQAGRYYRVKVEGSNLASGMYLYRLQSGSHVDVKKMVLMK